MIINPEQLFTASKYFVFHKFVYYKITAEDASSRIIMLLTSGSYTEALTGQTQGIN